MKNPLTLLQDNSIALGNNLRYLMEQAQTEARDRAVLAAGLGIVTVGGLFQFYMVLVAIFN